MASQMLKFWVNNPKTSHISRYNNIKRMYVHKTLCSYFSSQSIFKYSNNFDVMKNANFFTFFRLWMFFFLLTSLFIISINLSLVIIRKICELLIRCSLYYPKEFNICFLKGDKFAKYLSDPTNPKYPTDPFC